MSIITTVISRQSSVISKDVADDQLLTPARQRCNGGTDDVRSAEEVLVSLKKKASELNKLQEEGMKKEIKEIQKELAKAIKDLEELI